MFWWRKTACEPAKTELQHFIECVNVASNDVKARDFFGWRGGDGAFYSSFYQTMEWLEGKAKDAP